MLLALGAAALAAVAVVVTTASVVILQREENAKTKRDFDSYKIDSATLSDQLKRETADANARAVEAQLALEKFRAPRRPTPHQAEQLSAAISPLPTLSFDIAVNPTPEPQWLGIFVGNLLRRLGWSWQPRRTNGLAVMGPDQPDMGIVTGFVGFGIEVHESRSSDWIPIAEAIGKAFANVGIDVMVHIGNDNTVTADAIHIVVGTKP